MIKSLWLFYPVAFIFTYAIFAAMFLHSCYSIFANIISTVFHSRVSGQGLQMRIILLV